MQITGGRVSFKRQYQPEQYGSKGAEVELSFSLAEGEVLGKQLDQVGVQVVAKALELLGKKVGPDDTAKIETTTAGTPKTAKPKTKADLEKEQAVKLGVKSEAAGDGEDIGFDEDAEEAQPEISDAELSTAMNHKVAELKTAHGNAAPKLIKTLINTFVEPPKKSGDIPQKLRGQFLKKLKELK